MLKKYSTKELWKLYEELPQDLKEAIFSEKTADSISEICDRNEITDERSSEIARYTGRVLMGLLNPSELEIILEKELQIKGDVAKKIDQEISRFVLYPVKNSLETLYKTGGAPVIKPEVVSSETKEEGRAPSIQKEDIYREPIE